MQRIDKCEEHGKQYVARDEWNAEIKLRECEYERKYTSA